MSRNEYIRDSISILVFSTVSTWLFKQPHLTLLGILLTSLLCSLCLAHTCELVSLARTSNKATVTLPRLPFIRLALWCTSIAPLVKFGSATNVVLELSWFESQRDVKARILGFEGFEFDHGRIAWFRSTGPLLAQFVAPHMYA